MFVAHISIVMGRACPSPKARRAFGDFFKPEGARARRFLIILEPKTTRTRNICSFTKPDGPEPEFQARGYPTGLTWSVNKRQKIRTMAREVLMSHMAYVGLPQAQFAEKYFWPQWGPRWSSGGAQSRKIGTL